MVVVGDIEDEEEVERGVCYKVGAWMLLRLPRLQIKNWSEVEMKREMKPYEGSLNMVCMEG